MTLLEDLFLPNLLERDSAVRVGPHPWFPWEGVSDVQPFMKYGTVLDNQKALTVASDTMMGLPFMSARTSSRDAGHSAAGSGFGTAESGTFFSGIGSSAAHAISIHARR